MLIFIPRLIWGRGLRLQLGEESLDVRLLVEKPVTAEAVKKMELQLTLLT